MPQNTVQTFEADILEKLTLVGIKPEVLSIEEADIARRYFSEKERAGMNADQFCGPSRSFPITSQNDVNNAARLIGHADNPDAVKACIKRKAKANGWSLPDSWDTSDGDESDRLTAPVLVRADGTHDPFSGTHAHPHKAGGSQGDDDMHSHDHSHDGDSAHGHSHSDDEASRAAFATGITAGPTGDSTPDAPPMAKQAHPPFAGKHAHGHEHMDGYSHEHQHEHNNDIHHDHNHDHTIRTQMPDHAHLYVPITRIDNEKWEVEGVATSEALDTYGTVFSYDASKKAFQDWINRTANVREMHQRVAVGKGIGVEFDDANKQIIVRSRVSKGARDTWTKVQEGVLTGYSVGAINPVWDKTERNGKSYPYLTGYELTELSLVDNPSNPDGFGLLVCRADGLTEVIETSESEPPSALLVSSPASTTRAGARISSATQGQMHDTQKHLLYGAMANAKNCGCEGCQQFIQALDPDNDGDIDLGSYDDKDGDASQVIAQRTAQPGLEQLSTAIEERISQTLEKALSPIYSRQSQFLARLAQSQPPSEPEPSDSSVVAQLEALQQTVERLVQQVKPNEFPDEVRAELSAVRGLVEHIAAQPVAQGPMMNGLPRPVDKRLATDPVAPSMTQGNMQQVLNLLQEKGILDTLDKQVQAASLMVQPMRGRVGG